MAIVTLISVIAGQGSRDSKPRPHVRFQAAAPSPLFASRACASSSWLRGPRPPCFADRVKLLQRGQSNAFRLGWQERGVNGNGASAQDTAEGGTRNKSRAARVGQGSDGLQQQLVGGDSLYQQRQGV